MSPPDISRRRAQCSCESCASAAPRDGRAASLGLQAGHTGQLLVGSPVCQQNERQKLRRRTVDLNLRNRQKMSPRLGILVVHDEELLVLVENRLLQVLRMFEIFEKRLIPIPSRHRQFFRRRDVIRSLNKAHSLLRVVTSWTSRQRVVSSCAGSSASFTYPRRLSFS